MKWKDWDLNLKVRLIGELLTSMMFWMYFPFIALYFTDTFGKQLTGMLMMVPPILGVIANLFGGYFADRFGRKRMMVISSASQVAFLTLFAFSPSPWIDFLVVTGMSFMGNFYYPASMAMVADLTSPDQRRPVFAAFYATMNIGVVLGPFLGAKFFFGHRFELLLASAIVEAIFCFFLFTIVKETLSESNVPKSKGNMIIDQLQSYKMIFKDKVFLLYILAGIMIAQTFMQMDLYMAVYLKEYVPEQILFSLMNWDITVNGIELFGWMIGTNGLMVVLFTMIITRLITKWSDRSVLIISSLLFGLSLWLMAFTTNAWLLLGCMVLFTLAELIRTPVSQNFVAKLAPEDKRGQYMGASSLQFSIGRTIAPLAISLAAWMTPFEMFSIFFLTGILSAILYILMFKVMEMK